MQMHSATAMHSQILNQKFLDDGSSSVDIQSDSGDEWNESSGATADADVSGQDATGTDSNADAVFQSILGDITNAQEAGSQADPYVYLGENIDQYPNYKYTMIGDLAYVKANAIDLAKNPNAELKDGSIVLDNDEYWYYQKVNGKLTRSEISDCNRYEVPFLIMKFRKFQVSFLIIIIIVYLKYISAVNQMMQRARMHFRTVISDGIIQTIRRIRMSTFRFLTEKWQHTIYLRQITV